jgi:hypothetical protein
MRTALESADRTLITLRGSAGGAAGGAVISSVLLFLVSLWSVGPVAAFLAALLAAGFGAVLGALVGTLSGACLACARRQVLGNDWCARRLAFTTSAAPFLLPALQAPRELLWWLTAAGVSGLSGALLAPWVVRGTARGSEWSSRQA